MRDTHMPLLINKPSTNSDLERKLLEKHKRLEDDFLWIAENSDELRDLYPNKYVAVRKREVKYSAKNIKQLINIIVDSDENIEDFAIEYINLNSKNLLL